MDIQVGILELGMDPAQLVGWPLVLVPIPKSYCCLCSSNSSLSIHSERIFRGEILSLTGLWEQYRGRPSVRWPGMEDDASAERMRAARRAEGSWLCRHVGLPCFMLYHRPNQSHGANQSGPEPKGTCSLYKLII